MFAIEKAESLLLNVWIESDSLLLVRAFNGTANVPWQIRNRCNNCMHMAIELNVVCTHIPREGNKVADALAKNG
jgi:ribonuclease HI